MANELMTDLGLSADNIKRKIKHMNGLFENALKRLDSEGILSVRFLADLKNAVDYNNRFYVDYGKLQALREIAELQVLKKQVPAEARPSIELVGRLSNEFSQESEGNPVYVFLDSRKEGYDAWVNIKKYDRLVVFDKNDQKIFDQLLTMRMNSYTMDKFDPPIKPEWFDKGYSALLYKMALAPDEGTG